MRAGLLVALGRFARREVEVTSGAQVAAADPDAVLVEGARCTDAGLRVFRERFRLPADACSLTSEGLQDLRDSGYHHEAWERDMKYDHPSAGNRLALYLYPTCDHNGAFAVCSDGEREVPYGATDPQLEGPCDEEEGCAVPGLNRAFCARLVRASFTSSVWWKRVESVQDAARLVDGLGEAELSWIVLGGHGSHGSLWWGPGQGQLTGPQDAGRCDPAGEHAAETGTWNKLHPDVTRALETPHGLAYGKYPNWRAVQDATRAFFAALAAKAPLHTPVFLDSCLNGRLRRAHNDINMVSLVAYQLAGSEVCGSMTYLDEGMVRMLPRGEFLADPTQLRFELESDTGVNRMLCRHFPDGIKNYDYEHRATCDTEGQKKNVACAKRPRNEIEKAACEREELQQCMEWCEATEGCTAFVWFEKNRVNNCEIHFKECKLQEANFAQAFLRVGPDESRFWG